MLEHRCGACSRIRGRDELVKNFAGQWLQLRNLPSAAPVGAVVPGFRRQPPRRHSGREAEMFFDSILREDRSVLDLLTADYTFVNERLARHYGIPNIYGSQFRRVTLDRRARDAPRPARQGQRPAGDVEPGPHVSGAARQVGADEHPRRQSAGAAAQRAAAASSDKMANGAAGAARDFDARADGASTGRARRAPLATR